MLLRWTPRARRELRNVYEYLAQHNPSAALRTRTAIWDQAQQLAQYPQLGGLGRTPDTRELVIARTPYIVVYSIDPDTDTIQIRGVYHGAQRWPHEL